MDFRGTSRFRIERQIGSGGMGVVYEATDTERDGQRVALKTLRNLDATSLLRFKAEFRALADIHHENLVRFGELLAHESHWFFTMELLRGVDFLSWVRPGIASESLGERSTEGSLAAETLPAASSIRGSATRATRSGKLDEGLQRPEQPEQHVARRGNVRPLPVLVAGLRRVVPIKWTSAAPRGFESSGTSAAAAWASSTRRPTPSATASASR